MDKENNIGSEVVMENTNIFWRVKSEKNATNNNQNGKDNDYLVKYDIDKTVVLNDYLDILLNTESQPDGKGGWNDLSKVQQYDLLRFSAEKESRNMEENFYNYSGGLVLPSKEDDKIGSGNVVILGTPGSGKTTLAFQIAYSCTSKINNGIAIYYSLGSSRTHLINSMLTDGLNNEKIKRLTMDLPFSYSDDEKDKRLDRILVKDGTISPQIVFPLFTGRGLSENGSDSDAIFDRRFAELENMLKSIVKYNDYADAVKIKVVVLDSIDNFSNEPLKKYQIHKIFDLFIHYKIMCVYTVGENTYRTDNNDEYLNTMISDADTVIKLKYEPHHDYMCYMLSVFKSRFVKSVKGFHPYKIIDSNRKFGDNDEKQKFRKTLRVLPSLHHIIVSSRPRAGFFPSNDTDAPVLGNSAYDNILPLNYDQKTKKVSQIIAIGGKVGSYKSDIAINSVIWDALKGESYSGLIVRMSERVSLENNGFRIDETIFNKIIEKYSGFFVKDKPKKDVGKNNLTEINQYVIRFNNIDDIDIDIPKADNRRNYYHWKFDYKHNDIGDIYELVYKGGALLPEEFIEEIKVFIEKKKVKNIILTDCKYLGASFPFLINSPTSGNLFLSTLIGYIRNTGVNLIVTSSDSDYLKSENEQNKLRLLCDAVIDCEYVEENNVSRVCLSGEGLVDNNKKLYIENGETKTVRVFFNTDTSTNDPSEDGIIYPMYKVV